MKRGSTTLPLIIPESPWVRYVQKPSARKPQKRSGPPFGSSLRHKVNDFRELKKGPPHLLVKVRVIFLAQEISVLAKVQLA
jgi:hypothetical protein